MKVKFHAFQLRVTKGGIPLSDFFEYLEEKSGGEHLLYEKRILLAKMKGDYCEGAVVTLKDQRKFLELIRGGQKLNIEVTELESGRSHIDINYFRLHKDTGRGLYQHHRRSCSWRHFGALCGQIYSKLKFERREAAIKAGKKESKVKREIKGICFGRLIARREEFPKLLQQLSEIEAFDFTLDTFKLNKPMFSPVLPFVKREGRHIVFNTETGKVSQIASSIAKFVQDNEVESGVIHGLDDEGREAIVRVSETFDTFGTYNFDDIATRLVVDPQDVTKSKMLEEIRKLMGDKDEFFEVPETQPPEEAPEEED